MSKINNVGLNLGQKIANPFKHLAISQPQIRSNTQTLRGTVCHLPMFSTDLNKRK